MLDHRPFFGCRVTVLGLGRHGGGLGATRYLVSQDARVTVTDTANEATLAESLLALRDTPPWRLRLGGHADEDFRDAEFVVVNPAVRPDNPWVQRAKECGAIITSEIEMFLRACPARIIGVTGTVGKSSTCSMLAEIFMAAGQRTWLGGNIGRSLLSDLPAITPTDIVVLELSSFQLYWLAAEVSCADLAIITNIEPNHLDWHGNWSDYVAAKQRLLQGNIPPANAVFNPTALPFAAAQVSTATTCHAPWQNNRVPTLHVVGQHQRDNAAVAASAAEVFGIDTATIQHTLTAFRGLPHRLEWLADVQGRSFYNDSKATTPAATSAALAAIDRPVWLLAGGVNKGVSCVELGATIAKRVLGAAFFGQAANDLLEATRAADSSLPSVALETLAAALQWCWHHSKPGDCIVLSPACASFDQFRDYVDRGEHFSRLVRALE